MRNKFIMLLTLAMSALIFSTTASAQQKYSASLNNLQEVPTNNSGGRGSCSITLNSTETQFTVNCTYANMSSAVVAGHIHDNGSVGVNGPVRFNFNLSGGTSGTIGPLTFAVTPAQVADLRAKRWYVNIHTSNFPGGEIRGQVKITSTPFDIDGDGRTNIAVFRQSANTIFTLDNITNNVVSYPFGSGTGDNWLPSGDFDGDGRSDLILVKLNATTADAFHSTVQSGSNTVRTVRWGNFATANAERLAYGDYDGDGIQDIAVFRSGTGVWYILESSTNTGRAVTNFGAVGDSPSVGDYDKDGKTDLCVVRNVGGQLVWYILNSSNGQTRAVTFGTAATDGFFFFNQVDIDGDGAQDIMVSRSEGGNRVYYALRSSDGQPFYLQWGLATDTRLLGDYDGDGKTDFVARRTVSGQFIWYIYQSSNGQTRTVTFGGTGDTLAGDAEDETPTLQGF
jgi:hypothetical protein